jgi:hypothetical protein
MSSVRKRCAGMAVYLAFGLTLLAERLGGVDLRETHSWKAIAISCIDGRFIVRYILWLACRVGSIFDYRTEYGSTRAILERGPCFDRLVFILKRAVELHQIERCYLMAHVGCGAWKDIISQQVPEAEQREFHIVQLRLAAQAIHEAIPELTIVLVWVGWREIEVVEECCSKQLPELLGTETELALAV